MNLRPHLQMLSSSAASGKAGDYLKKSAKKTAGQAGFYKSRRGHNALDLLFTRLSSQIFSHHQRTLHAACLGPIGVKTPRHADRRNALDFVLVL